jgi:hypothetical protein
MLACKEPSQTLSWAACGLASMHLYAASMGPEPPHASQALCGSNLPWLCARALELLPMPYFHVVFTVPHELAAIGLQNKRILYELLLRVSAETLLEVAANPEHLSAQIGFLSVLHTWGQNLQLNPDS